MSSGSYQSARTFQQPRSLQFNSYNKPKPSYNPLPKLTISTSTKAQVQRNVISAPLPSQLAKVIKPEVQKTAPFSPASKGFEFPTPITKVCNSVTQRPLPKLTVVKMPPYERAEPAKLPAQQPERKVTIIRPSQSVSNTRETHPNQTPVFNHDDLKNNRSNVPSKILTICRAPSDPQTATRTDFATVIDKVTHQFKQIDLGNDVSRVPLVKEQTNDSFAKRSQNIDTSTMTYRLSDKPKHTVQDRLNQIKLPVLHKDYVPLPPVAQLSPVVPINPAVPLSPAIPLKFWTTGEFTNVERLEKYCSLKQQTSPDFKTYSKRNGKKFKYQCRCTIETFTYSTYPEEFDTEAEAREACAAKAVSIIKREEELSEYPIFIGQPQEIAIKIFDIVSESKTGVFLAEIPNLFR